MRAPIRPAGLTSYRARSPYGWVNVGARSVEEAWAEARRSTRNPTDLQIWNGTEYVPAETAK